MCFRPSTIETPHNCPRCQTPVDLGVDICPNCGEKLATAPGAPAAPGAPKPPAAPGTPNS